MKNIAVLASGSGGNFEAIVKSWRRGEFRANIKLLITDKKTALCLRRARKLGIEHRFINPNEYKSKKSFDTRLVKLLKKEKIDLIILAGYMRILSPFFIKHFKNKIINIHPSILPSFKGASAIKDAYDYGAKITGVTIHFVDEKIDHGPIIIQDCIKIKKGISLSRLEKNIHKLEHKLYPRAIKMFLTNKLKARGRHVEII